MPIGSRQVLTAFSRKDASVTRYRYRKGGYVLCDGSVPTGRLLMPSRNIRPDNDSIRIPDRFGKAVCPVRSEELP